MTLMVVSRSGVILKVDDVDSCVEFYTSVFGLRELFREQQGDFRLVCLDLAGSYLMIETVQDDNRAGESEEHPEDRVAVDPIVLRFNVPDIEAACEVLDRQGIAANIERYDWGSIIRLRDPAGNAVNIRDEKTFLAQCTNCTD